jgi:hypothetical protein
MENRKRRTSATALTQRKPWNEDDAREILDELSASGETLTAFARQKGLVPQRLAWWKKRLGGPLPSAGVNDARGATFVPVLLRAVEPEAPAAVELSGGVRVELRTLDRTSAAWVALLSQAVGGAS